MHARYIFLLLTAISLIIFYTHLVPFATLASTYLLFSRRPIQTLDPTTFDFNVPHYTNETTVVPRIIHQIKFGGPSYRMKSDWTRARTSCIALHPGWEVKLWEDEEANEFVLEHYGEEFHALYRGYEQEIMRTNVFRYLVLHQQGGVYLDLDLECNVPLDAFLGESFVTPPAQPTGVNNAFIVARPGHGFFAHLISNLPQYNLNWFSSPYVTNMMSTGCHFFSTMHLTYPGRQQDMKVLPWAFRLNGKVTNVLFTHLGASSWHRNDAAFILRLGQLIEKLKPIGHLIFPLTILSVLILVAATRATLRLHRHRSQYSPLPITPTIEHPSHTRSFSFDKLLRPLSPLSSGVSSSLAMKEV